MSNYLAKFDELNKLGKDYKGSLSDLLDTLYSEMRDAYVQGWEDVDKQTNDIRYKPDEDEIEELIFLLYDDKDAFDLMEEAYNEGDGNRISRIVSTEFHRMYNAGAYDRAKKGGSTLKVWVTMKDDKVRPTHEYIDEVGIPLEAEFYTYDGDSALYPGGFSNANNNVNCRCWLEFA